MSFQAVSWAWELNGLTATQKLVLMGLASYADEDEATCFPGQKTLAKRANVSVRTVQRALKELEILGAISRARRFREDGSRTSDGYKVHLDFILGDNLSPDIDDAPHDIDDSLGDIDDDPRRHGCQGMNSQLIVSSNSKKNSQKSEIDNSRPDVDFLLDVLDSCMEANGVKKPSRNKANINAARLLLDKDGYTVKQVEWIIRWSQNNEFWRSNILSMSKLREKFDQLKLQSQRQDVNKSSKSEQAHSFIERLQNIDDSSGNREAFNDHLQLRQ